MILDNTLYRLSAGTPKPALNWLRMASAIQGRTDFYDARARAGSLTETPWTHEIRRVLAVVPVSRLVLLPDTSIMTDIMMRVKPMMDQVLAPGSDIPVRKGGFVTGPGGDSSVDEFLTPCKSETPFLDLPLGKGTSDWNRVHPITILYADSLELCSNFLAHRFVYTSDTPTNVIVAVDTLSLAMKYIVHMKSSHMASLTDFIHHELVRGLYTDIVRCWMLQVIESVVDGTYRPDQVVTHSNIAVKGMVDHGIDDIRNLVALVGSKGVYVKDFTACELLPGRQSIRSWMLEMQHRFTFPSIRKVEYMQFLMEFPIVRIIMKLNNLSGTSNARRMNKELGIQLKRYKMMDILSGCQRRSVKQKLSGQLDELIALSEETISPSVGEPDDEV